MAVPKISEVESGAHSFSHGDANWTPLACSEHTEEGFVESCVHCIGTARETIEHALAVEADRRRA